MRETWFKSTRRTIHSNLYKLLLFTRQRPSFYECRCFRQPKDKNKIKNSTRKELDQERTRSGKNSTRKEQDQERTRPGKNSIRKSGQEQEDNVRSRILRRKSFHPHPCPQSKWSCLRFVAIEYLLDCFQPSFLTLETILRSKWIHHYPYHIFWRQLQKSFEHKSMSSRTGFSSRTGSRTSSSSSSYLHLNLDSLSPLTLNCDTPWMNSTRKK